MSDSIASVFGAACIWITVTAAAALVLRIAVDLWCWLASMIRIKVFVWYSEKYGYFSEEEMHDFLDDDARIWWEHHEDERCWSRYEDYREGVRAAATHLLRKAHVKILRPRREPQATLDLTRSRLRALVEAIDRANRPDFNDEDLKREEQALRAARALLRNGKP